MSVDPKSVQGDRAEAPVELITIPHAPEKVRVLFLAPWRGLLVHYMGRRLGLPCGQVWACKRCDAGDPPSWKGYTSVLALPLDNQPAYHAILEVTEHLQRQLADRELRGQVWDVQGRKAGRDRWPIYGTFVRQHLPESVPDPVDVDYWARRFYRCLTLRLGAEVGRTPQQWMPVVPSLVEAAPPAAAPPAAAPLRLAPVPAEAAPRMPAAEQPSAAQLLREAAARMRLPSGDQSRRNGNH
jgi:hypothetical protein